MAEEAVAAAADAEPPANDFMFSFSRTVMIFLIVQSGTKLLMGDHDPRRAPRKAGEPPPPEREPTAFEQWAKARLPEQPPPAPVFDTHDARGRAFGPQLNLWKEGWSFSVHAYTSCDATPATGSLEHLWSERGLTYSTEADNAREKRFAFSADNATRCVRRAWENVTVHAHVFATLRAGAFDPKNYFVNETAVCSRPLTVHRPPPKVKEGVHLLEARNATEVAKPADNRSVLFWRPRLDLRVVSMPESFQRNGVPDPIARLLQFSDVGDYFPPLHVDGFWVLSKSLVPVNASLEALTLDATFDVEGMLKWQLKKSMETQWEQQAKMGLGSDGDNDMIREMLLETQPWLLVLTVVVSILHMVFEGLAFRNNVKFWRGKKTLEGLSARAIAFNVVCQLVVLLYLLDNDTSWMILFSSGLGLCTELWKLTKAACVVREDGRWRLKLEESYAESPTKKYDDIATSHLMYAIAPLLVGYSAYSLVTGTHKGWYSWLVSSGVGFIYAFGFVMMTPQLYINYRLKSVAHLPWRAMVYKSLNTFIDDLFAFVIKMPTLHRLSCLRDDVIFLCTLYQRYLYGVDKSRINEFGQGPEETEEPAPAPAPSPRSRRPSAERPTITVPPPWVSAKPVAPLPEEPPEPNAPLDLADWCTDSDS